MATQVTLPRLSPGMNEASVARWLKRTGEQVARGEALFEVETEKVATEVPAPADGVLSIVVPEGTTVPIGAVLAVLAAPGEAPTAGAAPAAPVPGAAPGPAVTGPADAAPAPRAEPAAQPSPTGAASGAAAPAVVAGDEGRIIASPAARRLARELGVALDGLRGSGP